ncbi:G-type lectin S-receptor-like serine/threonine-protein kinase [Raphanus sativus]|uniref:Receptor-like serine/threonine-protein kinase n=1 Tax=Raphanus sativus TaxID=3726 RepID=A0A9W3DCU6_RAPSA|nr:G-type lectin S-receptor-like serine/threonine-protein kinase At1g34300 [Raphanus sativus]KAJ4905948.1 G-type lectin S-receptor-like serine/threonine-protein kinase [Raphanus sativus]
MDMTLTSLLLLFLLGIDFSSSLSIPLGSTLHASDRNQSWYSPNSVFSVSFIPAATPGSFLSAVLFSNTVPIWSPGTVDSGGSLRLLRSGSLRLVNSTGASVWDSGSKNKGVTSASLDDSGNLVLLSHRNTTVWSSFAHPSNVIVPTQRFTVGMSLRSRSYSFQLTEEGTLNLKWNNSTVYWSQELNNSSSNLSSPTFVLERNGVASIYDSSGVLVVVSVRSDDYGEGEGVFRFLKLEEDGNLRIFSVSKGGEIQTQTWVAVADQCQVFGFCGDFGICRYDGFVPTCDCPSENFVPIDVNDMRKGCRRKVELEDCRGNEGMLELNNTRFLTYAPELSTQRFTLGTEACRANCLADSLCFASVLMADGSGVCFQKLSGLVSGYTSPSVPSTSSLKVCKPVLPYSTVKKHDERSLIQALIIALAVIATAFCLVAIVGALWCCCWRNSFKFGALSSHHTLLEYASSAPMRFSYKELQRCTKGFKEKLGAGGFGAVYKGMLVNRTVVAVKRLEGIEQGEKQFRTEVATIGSTHHLNLVRLIGFCSQGRHRLLVYEFMKNGSLDSFLFAADSGRLLNWQYRFSIAIGTAKAILYLHEECSNCIVHCDIKPENILLDENFNAKVSDFGLAKLMPSDKRYWNMSFVRGTRGYLAPEWIANLPITSNSDVYSYGMVLLEIVSGRRNFEVSDETNHRKFSEWAYEEFEKGNIEVILDKCLQTDETVDMEQVKRMVQVSFWCIQKHPSRRPSMGKVVQMLEGIIEIAKPLAPNALADIQDTENS